MTALKAIVVEAADKDGTVRGIPFQYPGSWPDPETEGGKWKHCCARMSRSSERLWEDWQGNGSGHATEHVWACFENETEQVCGRAVDGHLRGRRRRDPAGGGLGERRQEIRQ